MILIDMQMPECCDNCPMLDDRGDYPMCIVNQAQHGYTFRTSERRMPECPLHKTGGIVRGEVMKDSDAAHGWKWEEK